MSSVDTRPHLTARWRALERKGWMFRIGSASEYSAQGRILHGRRDMHSAEMRRHLGDTAASEQEELDMLTYFEQEWLQ